MRKKCFGINQGIYFICLIFINLTSIIKGDDELKIIQNYLNKNDVHRNLMSLCPLIVNNEPCIDLSIHNQNNFKKLMENIRVETETNHDSFSKSSFRRTLVSQRSLCCIRKECAKKCDPNIFENDFLKNFPKNIELLHYLDKNLIENILTISDIEFLEKGETEKVEKSTLDNLEFVIGLHRARLQELYKNKFGTLKINEALLTLKKNENQNIMKDQCVIILGEKWCRATSNKTRIVEFVEEKKKYIF